VYTGGIKTPVERRKTPALRASTSVLLAASRLLEGISGRYFEDRNDAQQVTKRPTDFTGGYAPYAVDPGKGGPSVRAFPVAPTQGFHESCVSQELLSHDQGARPLLCQQLGLGVEYVQIVDKPAAITLFS
jgi:hypothetical protein